MRRFELTEDLLTGVEDIDAQHRVLLNLGNKVVDPSAIKGEEKIFTDALAFLGDYVVYHFVAEEYVMEAANYPHYEHHRLWHERFKQEVSRYVEQARREGITKDLRLKVSFAIEDWMLEHIRVTDRALANFLRQRESDVTVHLPDARTLKNAGKLPENFNEGYTGG